MDMSTSTKGREMTVETFPIDSRDEIRVVVRDGYYHTAFVRSSWTLFEHHSFGAGETGLRLATADARQWAFGIRFDRSR